MNHAPAVQYPVGRSVWTRRSGWVLLVLCALVQASWLLALDGADWPGAWWVATFFGLSALVWVVWCDRHPPLGELLWQPSDPGRPPTELPGRWLWRSAAYRHGTPLQSLERVWDGQGFMLLRARTVAGLTLWLWLESAVEPEQWSALRRAVRAHQLTTDLQV